MCCDFNARTGDLCDFIEDDLCNDFGGGSTAGLSTDKTAHYERCNNDTQCNTYGPLLIDLCKTANVFIVNENEND